MTALLDAPAPVASLLPEFFSSNVTGTPRDTEQTWDLSPRCPHCGQPVVDDDLRHWVRSERRWLCNAAEVAPAPIPLAYALRILGCPSCGNPMHHVASGRPIAGTETSVIVRCPKCLFGGEHQVMVRLIPTRERPDLGIAGTHATHATCGTDSGYFAHLRQHHDEPCGPCRSAHASAERGREARKRTMPALEASR